AGGVRRKLLTFLVLIILIVGLLPIIVAKTYLRNVILSRILPSDAVRVTIGDASLSWISNPSGTNIEVKNAADETLLTAESIVVDRTPLKLALNSRDLGTIRIVHPTIYLKVRPDGSNVEDLKQKLLPAAPDTTEKMQQPTASVQTRPGSKSEYKPIAYRVE